MGLLGIKKSSNRFAFTFVETLITIAIIGIIAILTLPNFIKNYQKKVFSTQFQKSYSQLQRVLNLALADNQQPYIADSNLLLSINGYNIASAEQQNDFVNTLSKYLRIRKVCHPYDVKNGCHDIVYTRLNGSSLIPGDENAVESIDDEDSNQILESPNRLEDLQIFTNDGTIFYFSANFSRLPYSLSPEECNDLKKDGGRVCQFHLPMSGNILIDINGGASPNSFGRDLFAFVLDIKGQPIPVGSTALNGESNNWKSDNENTSCLIGNAIGRGCAGRIIEDDWKMEY